MFYLYKIISDHYAVCLSRELNSKGHTARLSKLNGKRKFWLGKMFESVGKTYLRSY